MYKMYDEIEAVREIQIHLNEIFVTEKFIAPSGIYDDDTRGLVRSFQEKKGLSVTGKVDDKTRKAIYEEYILSKEIKKLEDISGQKLTLPYKLGDYGEQILLFNRFLTVVLDSYGVYHTLRDSRMYSSATEDAHKSLRVLFGFDDGYADWEFLLRLMKEYHAIKKQNIGVFGE